MIAIVICGGSGTRLYPASTDFLPKQFIKLFGEKTLLEMTVERLLFLSVEKIILVSPKKYYHLIKKITDSYENKIFEIISEPLPKNTGPAIISGLLHFSNDEEKEYLIVPSDHYLNEVEFKENLEKAYFFKDFGLVVFSKTPTYPETGFGYISHYRGLVTTFHEKPSVEAASSFIESGGLWNMGYFFGKKKIFLREMEEHSPTQLNLVRRYFSSGGNDFYYKSLDSVPFDKMIMEKTKNAYCVEYIGEWSDVGNWKEASSILQKDIISLDCDDIFNISKYPIKMCKSGGVGIIYDDESYALVKNIIPTQKNFFFQKPWGWVRRLLLTENSVVSHILIFGGKRTSLQFHRFRSERINILSGEGELTLGGDTFKLKTDDTHLIPGGCLHRIYNNGDEDLVFIEIQSGICEEDDITRIEDDYGR